MTDTEDEDFVDEFEDDEQYLVKIYLKETGKVHFFFIIKEELNYAEKDVEVMYDPRTSDYTGGTAENSRFSSWKEYHASQGMEIEVIDQDDPVYDMVMEFVDDPKGVDLFERKWRHNSYTSDIEDFEEGEPVSGEIPVFEEPPAPVVSRPLNYLPSMLEEPPIDPHSLALEIEAEVGRGEPRGEPVSPPQSPSSTKPPLTAPRIGDDPFGGEPKPESPDPFEEETTDEEEEEAEVVEVDGVEYIKVIGKDEYYEYSKYGTGEVDYDTALTLADIKAETSGIFPEAGNINRYDFEADFIEALPEKIRLEIGDKDSVFLGIARGGGENFDKGDVIALETNEVLFNVRPNGGVENIPYVLFNQELDEEKDFWEKIFESIESEGNFTPVELYTGDRGIMGRRPEYFLLEFYNRDYDGNDTKAVFKKVPSDSWGRFEDYKFISFDLEQFIEFQLGGRSSQVRGKLKSIIRDVGKKAVDIKRRQGERIQFLLDKPKVFESSRYRLQQAEEMGEALEEAGGAIGKAREDFEEWYEGQSELYKATYPVPDVYYEEFLRDTEGREDFREQREAIRRTKLLDIYETPEYREFVVGKRDPVKARAEYIRRGRQLGRGTRPKRKGEKRPRGRPKVEKTKKQIAKEATAERRRLKAEARKKADKEAKKKSRLEKLKKEARRIGKERVISKRKVGEAIERRVKAKEPPKPKKRVVKGAVAKKALEARERVKARARSKSVSTPPKKPSPKKTRSKSVGDARGSVKASAKALRSMPRPPRKSKGERVRAVRSDKGKDHKWKDGRERTKTYKENKDVDWSRVRCRPPTCWKTEIRRTDKEGKGAYKKNKAGGHYKGQLRRKGKRRNN